MLDSLDPVEITQKLERVNLQLKNILLFVYVSVAIAAFVCSFEEFIR